MRSSTIRLFFMFAAVGSVLVVFVVVKHFELQGSLGNHKSIHKIQRDTDMISSEVHGDLSPMPKKYVYKTWSAWWEAVVSGGSAQYTEGYVDFLHCPNTESIPTSIGGSVGAFVEANVTWSSEAIVKVGKKAILQTNGRCCRANLTWPRCWADDTPNRPHQRSLKTIHIDKRVLQRAGFEKATLANGKLYLKCVGNRRGYFSDSINSVFKWKSMDSYTTDTTSPMVLVRCLNPCKGAFQRFIEWLQMQDWSWTMTPLDFPTFKYRYHREQNQCVDYDLILTQVVKRPEVIDRINAIKHQSSNSDGKNNKLRILYIFMDSTSRRNFINNFPETKAVLQTASNRGIAKTFAFPLMHSLGFGTTERAFYSFVGGSRVSNFGAPSFKFWKRLDLLWERAKKHGWYTSYTNELCFTHEHRDLFKAKDAPKFTTRQRLDQLGDYVLTDVFCGGCDDEEEFCDSESSAQYEKQYRNGDYHIKNFLGDERSCEGGRRPSSAFLEWTVKVMNQYKEESGFLMYEWAAAHMFREHEHICAAQRHFDGSFAAFINELLHNGMLDESVIILGGDHGNWHMEEKNNPFMSITVPQKLLQQHPDIAQNLHKNQRSIVTHLDLHETVVHLMDLISPIKSNKGNEDNVQSLQNFSIKEYLKHGQNKDPHGWRSGMPGFPGISLLKPLSEKRTCEDAGVDKGDENCYVSEQIKGLFKKIKPHPWFTSQLGSYLEIGMNNLTARYRPICKEFTFNKVLKIESREDRRSDGTFEYNILYNVKEFSKGAGNREFTAIVTSSIPPSVATRPFQKQSSLQGNFQTLDRNQVSKWGINKACMPKQIAKKVQTFCQCLDDSQHKVTRY